MEEENIESKMSRMADATIDMIDHTKRVAKATLMGHFLSGAAMKLNPDALDDNMAVDRAEELATKVMRRCGME